MKTDNFICETCGPVDDTRIESRAETYPVMGEQTSCRARVRVCARCGRDVSDRRLDERNLQAVYDLYRQKHNVITPPEIRAMRERYGLSQRSLGALLGWGEVTVHRYEQGSLPDDAHNQVLRFIEDPFNMEYMAEVYGHRLHDAARRKLTERLTESLSERTAQKVVNVLGQSTSRKKADVFTGFREFNPEALMEMMVFFASKAAGVWKTKLNKLLWYSDFIHYRYHSVSISGATYVRLPYGPVPDRYAGYLGALCEKGTLNINEIDFGCNSEGENVTGEKLVATRRPHADVLPATALAVLEAVHSHFERIGSSEIVRISHGEAGYVETPPGDRISYQYADRLKVDVSPGG